MAFFSHALAPSDSSLIDGKAHKAPRNNVFARFFAAMQDARLRQAEKEIALYLRQSGGLTDSTEREIERRILSNPRTFL